MVFNFAVLFRSKLSPIFAFLANGLIVLSDLVNLSELLSILFKFYHQSRLHFESASNSHQIDDQHASAVYQINDQHASAVQHGIVVDISSILIKSEYLRFLLSASRPNCRTCCRNLN
jgi:hypothetical protein